MWKTTTGALEEGRGPGSSACCSLFLRKTWAGETMAAEGPAQPRVAPQKGGPGLAAGHP